MGRLEGKVALVTGGARGIGKAVTERFVAEGAKVVVAGVLEEAGRELCRRPSRGSAVLASW